MGKYEVIVSERARRMLAGHLQFLARKSPAAARALKDQMINAMQSLRIMPERYPVLEAKYIPPNKYHKMVVQKRYLVLYQIKDRVVYVDLIIDCRQDYQWLLE